MTVLEVAQPPGIAPVEAARTPRERLLDAVDPLWRRLLWTVAFRRTSRRIDRRAYATTATQLSAGESATVREILARRHK